MTEFLETRSRNLRLIDESLEKSGPEGTIAVIRDLLERNDDWLLMVRLAECLLQRGEFPEAERLLQKAEFAEPSSWNIYSTRAEICFIRKEFEEAERWLEKSMSLAVEESHKAHVLCSYARYHLSRHEYAKAKEYAAQAQRILPEDPSLRETLGKIEERTWWTGEDVGDAPRSRISVAGETSPAAAGSGPDGLDAVIAEHGGEQAAEIAAPVRERLGRILASFTAFDPFDRENRKRYGVFLENIIRNEIETARRGLVLSSKPRSLTVSVTNYCNLNCVMCESKAVRSRWTIPERTMEEVAGYFPYLEYIMWQGGEVLMLDGFKDILRTARSYPHMKQAITTNGMLLTEELADEIAAQPDMAFTFSIDAVDRGLYERIRRGAKFDTLLRNIGLLNELRKRHGSRLKLNINVVVMRSNYRHLQDILEFAGEHGFDFVLLTSVKGNRYTGENIFQEKDAEALRYLAGLSGTLEKKAAECGVLLHNWLPIEVQKTGDEDSNGPAAVRGQAACIENSFLCNAPWQRMYINCFGDVYPECVCRIPRPVGNVDDHSLAELWNSRGMQAYRKRIVEKTFGDLCNSDCYTGVMPPDYLRFNR